MKVQLKSGMFVPIMKPDVPFENGTEFERKAVLCYVGQFTSMDGPVTITAEHLKRIADNHNTRLQKNLGGPDEVYPMKICPPIQLDHSVSARDTVGRLVGKLELADYELESGQRVVALYGTPRILGRENVEKVVDGRWTHFSIGADLDTGNITELTITPFPAAPEAALLSKVGLMKNVDYKGCKIEVRKEEGSEMHIWSTLTHAGKCQSEAEAMTEAKKVVDEWLKANGLTVGNNKAKLSEGENMDNDKLKKHLTGRKKMSEDEAVKKLAEMPEEEKTNLSKEADEAEQNHQWLKKHLTGAKQMSEEDAEKHLSDLDDENREKLSTEAKEHEAKMQKEKEEEEARLSAEKAEKEESHKRMSAFVANKDKIVELRSGFAKTRASAKLAMKKHDIMVRCSALITTAKMLPAEYEKLNIEELSTKTDEVINARLQSYEDRPTPVVHLGQFGTMKGVNMAHITEKVKMSSIEALEEETRQNMPFKRLSGKKKGEVKLQEGRQTPEEVNIHVDTAPHVDMETEYNEVCKMMDSDVGQAKAALKKFMDKCRKMTGDTAGPLSEDGKKQMSALASDLKTMEDQFDEILKLVSPVIGIQE